jgi:integrase
MPRRPTGQIVEHDGTDGRIYRALRFTAYGKRRYVSLGPVSVAEAERDLRHVLADVERGVWQPPSPGPKPAEAEPTPTFHEYAEDWWLRMERHIAPQTRANYRWRLETHLLPHFARTRIDAITFGAVERYIADKLAEDRPLSPTSINMTVTLLAAILETAVERDLIVRNPAKGKGRRVRERAPHRSYLDTATQIDALLASAGKLDSEARADRSHVERRAMIATLIFAGLRISELCALRWRDIDFGAGWLHVAASKTDAGVRRVKLREALRCELRRVRDGRGADTEIGYLVFPTRNRRPHRPDNFRSRVLQPAVLRANANLVAHGSPPLPERLTPHSLRRTFASILYALGEDPGIVMDEMGHTDPALALRVYRQAMRRGVDEQAALKDLVEGP